jgi:hypothetical protein
MDAADQILSCQGKRYRLWNGRLLLNWAKPAPDVLHHRTGCVLCCDVRVTTGMGSPPRHPPSCDNCISFTGPRPDPCRYCGMTAHVRDDDGRPVHKVCIEHAITAAILSAQERQTAA